MSERVAGFKCAICERVGSCAPVDEQYAWARSARTRGDAQQYTRAHGLACVRHQIGLRQVETAPDLGGSPAPKRVVLGGLLTCAKGC